jgi:flagellar hook assembly protein FlgD
VTRLWFAVLSEDKASEDGVIRTFPDAGEDWAPGEHTATVTWDGRDDDGVRVAPGGYRLVGNAITNSSREVLCNDGSGPGVEVSTGSLEGAGLGSFRVGG